MVTQPLQDKTIVLTRSEEKSKELAEEIERLGGSSIILPLIEFRPIKLSKEDEQLLYNLDQVEWLVFTSVNGVQYFFYLIHNLRITLPTGVKIAVVGTKTKEAIVQQGHHPTLLPKEYVAEGLVEGFQEQSISNKTVVYIKGNLARDIIPNELSQLGAEVKELIVYETFCPTEKTQMIKLLEQKVDAITFTSPSTVHHFVQLLEGTQWREWLHKVVVCCIGPITEKAALAVEIVPTIVPHTYTMDHLLQELISYYQEEGNTHDLF
ncbi:uroporphyrinogen-III synthase [Bacillus sp. AK128]